jgi:hypothetical protein
MELIKPTTIVELAAAGATVDVVRAGRALGIGRSLTYELLRRGEFPVRVLRLGSRVRVPTADLIALLCPTEHDPAA